MEYKGIFDTHAHYDDERFDEDQTERMYTLSHIGSALYDAGFELIGAYSDFNFKQASDNDERIYIVARCIKK